MRIKDLLSLDSIELNGTVKDKKDALDKVVDLMVKSGKIDNRSACISYYCIYGNSNTELCR